MDYRLKSLEVSYPNLFFRARLAYHALPIQLWHGEIKAFLCLQALLGVLSKYQTVISCLEHNLRKAKISLPKLPSLLLFDNDSLIACMTGF